MIIIDLNLGEFTMRCICCDTMLSPYESTRRHALTNEFMDMCKRCMRDMPNVPMKDRRDLVNSDDLDTSGDDEDLSSVTNCYTLDVDNDEM